MRLAHEQDSQRPSGVCAGLREFSEPGERRQSQTLRFIDRHQGRPTLARCSPGDGSLASRLGRRPLGDLPLPRERGERPVQDRRVGTPNHASAEPLHVACHATQYRRLPGPGLAGQ